MATAALETKLPASVKDRLRRPRTLWLAFAVVHLYLFIALLPRILEGSADGDVVLYRTWAYDGLENGNWVGITESWVYPVAALLPIIASTALGYGLYQVTWWILLTALNAGAVLALTGNGHRTQGYPAAYWWMSATVLLTPVAVGRIDGLTGPMVIAGLMLIVARPVLASAILALATWIKVWPAAVIAVIVVAGRKRLTLILTGAAVSAVIAAVVVAVGGLPFLFSFIGAQADRGMQIEAPFTTPGLWQAVLGLDGAYVYNDRQINTVEIRGAMGAPMAMWMSPLLGVAALAITALLFWAMRRGMDRQQLVLLGSLAMVSAFVVFNKVGSPQFQLWIIAVVAVGLAFDRRRWTPPGLLMLFICALTTLVFPYLYGALIDLNPIAALVLTVRNALLLLVLAWPIRQIIRLSKAASAKPTAALD